MHKLRGGVRYMPLLVCSPFAINWLLVGLQYVHAMRQVQYDHFLFSVIIVVYHVAQVVSLSERRTNDIKADSTLSSAKPVRTAFFSSTVQSKR